MRKAISILFAIVLFATNCNVLPATGLPTFDFTNFTQAVESLVKAVNFYNTSISQAKQYISQIETLSKGLQSGDFNTITNSIAGMLNMISKVSGDIESILEYCRSKREEAEVRSKKATLEIIKIITDPSIKGIKDYADRRNFDNLDMSERIRRIAKDTKDGISLLANDHSESAKKAMDELDLNLESLTSRIANIMDVISKASGENSKSITALESLSGLNDRYLSLGNSIESLARLAKSAKNELSDTDAELKREEERWQNIIDKIDQGISNTKKLNKSIRSLKGIN